MKHYRQLNQYERCQIQTLKSIGLSITKIAIQLDRDKSSISRELSRNKEKKGYDHEIAHKKALKRRQHSKGTAKIMTEKMIRAINEKIRQEWSPEQVTGWFKAQRQQMVSHERIYQHIWLDKEEGGDLYRYLRRCGKKYVSRSSNKRSRGQIIGRIGIEKRPKIVDKRSRIGDWEIDTIIGKNHQSAIVSIVERKSRFTLLAKVKERTGDLVTKATLRRLLPYKDLVYTMTSDNGKEFSYHQRISKCLGAKFYFANPYCSWERGLNENTNGLVRQYIPKKTSFTELPCSFIRKVENRLNDRPRKCLGFKTPREIFEKAIAA